MVNFTDELSEDSSIHCMQNEAWDSAILKYFWKDFLFIDVCTIKRYYWSTNDLSGDVKRVKRIFLLKIFDSKVLF